MQTLANSLQNIPDNFARMLVQVQNYTRRNILPFMQTGRLTDLIWIRPKPNSTIVIDKKRINNGTTQGQNFSFNWFVSRDFTSTEKVGIEVPTTSEVSTTLMDVQTTIRAVKQSTSTEVYSTSDKVLTDVARKSDFWPDLTTTTFTIPTMRTTVQSLPDDYFWPGTSTSSEKTRTTTTTEKLETSTQHHIQKIPKRGEKSLITIPQPFTIVINPNDLTTPSPQPVTTTTPVPKKFESYVQKIPPKKSKEKPVGYTVIRKHPWVRDFKIGEKVVMVQNEFGGHMRYRINPDGRYELW